VVGLAAPFVACAFTAWIVVGFLEVEGAVAGPVVGVVGFLALLGGFPVALVLARDFVHAALALRRDLRRGEALAFGDGDDALAVLPASLRVVGRGGFAVRPEEEVELGEAEAAPSTAATYALLAAEVPAELRAGGWVKRALTPAEREEVARHAARLARPSRSLVAVTVVLAAAAASLAGGGASPSPSVAGRGLWSGVAAALLLALGWWRSLRRRGAAARLREDAEEGWAHRGTADGVEVEVLPRSGAPWTGAGAPAAWRLDGRR
jgi:hypothetical protein